MYMLAFKNKVRIVRENHLLGNTKVCHREVVGECQDSHLG